VPLRAWIAVVNGFYTTDPDCVGKLSRPNGRVVGFSGTDPMPGFRPHCTPGSYLAILERVFLVDSRHFPPGVPDEEGGLQQ